MDYLLDGVQDTPTLSIEELFENNRNNQNTGTSGKDIGVAIQSLQDNSEAISKMDEKSAKAALESIIKDIDLGDAGPANEFLATAVGAVVVIGTWTAISTAIDLIWTKLLVKFFGIRKEMRSVIKQTNRLRKNLKRSNFVEKSNESPLTDKEIFRAFGHAGSPSASDQLSAASIAMSNTSAMVLDLAEEPIDAKELEALKTSLRNKFSYKGTNRSTRMGGRELRYHHDELTVFDLNESMDSDYEQGTGGTVQLNLSQMQSVLDKAAVEQTVIQRYMDDMYRATRELNKAVDDINDMDLRPTHILDWMRLVSVNSEVLCEDIPRMVLNTHLMLVKYVQHSLIVLEEESSNFD